MKEWCMKHPWLTFFIIYDGIIEIANIFRNHRRERFLEMSTDAVVEGIREVREKVKEKTESEDRTIGFKAS